MQSRLLLDVVVRQRAAVLQLLAGEDQALLLRRDALLVLDLRLHVLDGVRRLDIEGDRLTSEGLDEDLCRTTKRTLEKPRRDSKTAILQRGVRAQTRPTPHACSMGRNQGQPQRMVTHARFLPAC